MSKPPEQPASSVRCASPPCFTDVLDRQGGVEADPVQAQDVARWRKGERERLLSLRMALPPDEREWLSAEIGRQLDLLLADLERPVVSVYWPIRAEPDLRGWMASAHARGIRLALPVVVAPSAPLEFRHWQPGCQMEHGVWRIPQPAARVLVTPTVSIAPLVGYDRGCYRLGYGGGFFDRTLGHLLPQPMAVGVGYAALAIATIFPQPVDIPMDWILTGAVPPVRRVAAHHSC